jgi:hypothetical protein
VNFHRTAMSIQKPSPKAPRAIATTIKPCKEALCVT